MSESAPTGQIASVFKSFKDAIWHVKYSAYLLVLGLAFSYVKGYLGLSETFSQWFDRLIISACLLLLVAGGVIREIQVKRDRRYATIQKENHLIFHKIRDLISYIDSVLFRASTEDQLDADYLNECENSVKAALTSILDNISSSFSLVSGVPCRATLKGITLKDGDSDVELFVYTIARDSDSETANTWLDGERLSQWVDKIEENEDFEIIADNNNTERWFFDNFLPRRQSYKNSHDDDVRKERLKPRRGLIKSLAPRVGWKLPYVATIVWPVQQQNSLKLKFVAPGCIGFLAVDSDRKNSFSEKNDPYLGLSFADALFHPLNKLSILSDLIDSKTTEK